MRLHIYFQPYGHTFPMFVLPSPSDLLSTSFLFVYFSLFSRITFTMGVYGEQFLSGAAARLALVINEGHLAANMTSLCGYNGMEIPSGGLNLYIPPRISVPNSQPSVSFTPTSRPSSQPSTHPSVMPSRQPSSFPSTQPSTQPSGEPSTEPTTQSTNMPQPRPTGMPSSYPSQQPSSHPSQQPSSLPSQQPVLSSRQPAATPTSQVS